jgi:hypothetical protein
MSGYYYECPNCTRLHPVNPDDMNHADRPDRLCMHCYEEGCEDCMPEEVCRDCDDDFDRDFDSAWTRWVAGSDD